jgi:hypothetical protein
MENSENDVSSHNIHGNSSRKWGNTADDLAPRHDEMSLSKVSWL